MSKQPALPEPADENAQVDAHQYDPSTGNSEQVTEFDKREAWEELASRLGLSHGDMPSVLWPGNNPKRPIVDANQLPDGTTMADVTAALNAMKNDGWF